MRKPGRLQMDYEIAIDDEHGIAELRLRNAISHAEHLKAREQLVEICRDHRLHKILVDARALRGAPPSTIDLFDFAASWGGLARDVRLVLAGVVPQDVATQKWWKFGETVAANRGFETRIFEEIDEARAWLQDA